MQRKIFLLASAVLLASASLSGAATIQVPGDQPTIQAGIDTAQDGDTVLVAPGSYLESFSILSKEVHLLSESGSEHTFLSPTESIVVAGGANAQITGFTFRSGSAVVNSCCPSGFTRLNLTWCRFVGFVTSTCVSGGVETDVEISHCLFATQQLGAAASIYSGSFINNTVNGGVDGLRVGPGPVSARNNILTGLSGCAIGGGSGPTYDEYNDIWNCAGGFCSAPERGVGSLNIDPQFISPRTNYYELQTGSPCIDAGDPNPIYNDPDGSRCDMGAYPFSPDSINPVILGVTDVPHDQGGKVTVRWGRSKYDLAARGGITEYSIWRAIPHGGLYAATPHAAHLTKYMATSLPTVRVLTTSVGTYEWEWIGSVPGHYFDSYSFTAATLYDSTAQSSGKHYFLVSAHSPDGIHFYDSGPDSGYSVDNLAPPAPAILALAIRSTGLFLQWRASAAPDVSDYHLYRDTVPGFSINGMTPLGIQTDTALLDNTPLPGKRYYYLVTASDFAGNEGPPSNQVSGVFCYCPRQGDINGSGFVDVTDVLKVIQIAFINGSDVQDPSCPKTRGDVNNSGVVDVNDVLYIIKTAFTNGPNPVNPCIP